MATDSYSVYPNVIARLQACASMGVHFHTDPEQTKALVAEIEALAAPAAGAAGQKVVAQLYISPRYVQLCPISPGKLPDSEIRARYGDGIHDLVVRATTGAAGQGEARPCVEVRVSPEFPYSVTYKPLNLTGKAFTPGSVVPLYTTPPAASAVAVDGARMKIAMQAFWQSVEESGCHPPILAFARDTLMPRWVRAALTAALGSAGGVAVDDGLEFFAVPEGLNPQTVNLVARFATALAEKLAAAERKYGYSDGWADPDWMDECRAKLVEHVAKGDPRDVAAFCAFLWHHGERTALPAVAVDDAASLRELAEALDMPEGYEVSEFLPGQWDYRYERDGESMVSGATWNHPALAAVAAWGAALAAALGSAGGVEGGKDER